MDLFTYMIMKRLDMNLGVIGIIYSTMDILTLDIATKVQQWGCVGSPPHARY